MFDKLYPMAPAQQDSYYSRNGVTFDPVSAMIKTLEKNSVVVIKFEADWCEACHHIAPTLTELSELYPEIPMISVDVDLHPELKQWARIKALPMIIMYKDGRMREFAFGVHDLTTYEKKLRRLINVSTVK